jgi:hypothetical protein
VPGAPHLPV